MATTLHRSKGRQFIVHAKPLLGAPYDGHTLATVVPEMEQWVGAPMQRILADRGYRATLPRRIACSGCSSPDRSGA